MQNSVPFLAPQARDKLPDNWTSRPVAFCIKQLTVFFAIRRELLRTEAAWLAGVPYWDAKVAIAEHLLNGASAAESLLLRLHELKATAAEHKGIAGVDDFVARLASAANGDEWLNGLYRQIKPWLVERLTEYLDYSDPVMDAPSRRILLPIIANLRSEIRWFESFSPKYSAWEQPDTSEWQALVKGHLSATEIAENSLVYTGVWPLAPTARANFEGIAQVRRDSIFPLARKSEFPREGGSFEEKRFLVFYNHTQEMQFAESLGAIMYETTAMPWAFHHDLARHVADEVRHAEMGRTRLEQLGVPLPGLPMLTQHYEFRANLDPLERFCLMTLVMEATAFERKRANVELFEEQADTVSALYETYDIKDEMLHTNLGHVWVPILLRVYHDSRAVPELVEHCRSLIAQVISEYPANAANMLRPRTTSSSN